MTINKYKLWKIVKIIFVIIFIIIAYYNLRSSHWYYNNTNQV